MAMFSKRHYEVLARVIRQRTEHNPVDQDYAEGWHGALCSIKVALIAEFKADNPRFDAERFNKACEPRGDKQ